MPLVIPLPTGAQVQLTFWGRLFEQVIMNTFRYQAVGTPNPATDYRTYLDDFFSKIELAGGLQEKYLSTLPTNLTVYKKTVQTYWPIRQRYVSDTMSEAGTSSFITASTANVAASIKRMSDTIGPRGVGRVQIPVPAGAMIDGHLQPTYMTGELQDLADQMIETIPGLLGDINWVPVLFGVTDDVAHTSEIYATEVEDTVRTMHRRTVRLGI